MRRTFNSQFPSGINSYPQSSSWSSLTPISPAASLAGRKRSRDEAALNLEDFPPEDSAADLAQWDNEDEWVYGEGMMLIKPGGSSYIIAASSQTGTWADEKAEEDVKATVSNPSPERSFLRAAKSKRLDLTSTPSVAEAMDNGSMTTPGASEPGNSNTEPTVDDFTRHLGIGWSLISTDPDIQAAARGWARYIDNHYPVTDAKIRLQSRGLASYLVEANEGYFLFGEDLKQGKLVSTSLEKTWENLRGPVPVFDVEAVMEAGETPKVNGVTQTQAVEMDEVDGDAVNSGAAVAGQTIGFEMDMS